MSRQKTHTDLTITSKGVNYTRDIHKSTDIKFGNLDCSIVLRGGYLL